MSNSTFEKVEQNFPSGVDLFAFFTFVFFVFVIFCCHWGGGAVNITKK